jgi:hypothetical protein
VHAARSLPCLIDQLRRDVRRIGAPKEHGPIGAHDIEDGIRKMRVEPLQQVERELLVVGVRRQKIFADGRVHAASTS